MTRLRKHSMSTIRPWSVSASGVLRRGLKRRCARVHRGRCVRANWTASRKHTWWRWSAARHPKVVRAGCFAYWPTSLELEVVDDISYETVRQRFKKRSWWLR